MVPAGHWNSCCLRCGSPRSGPVHLPDSGWSLRIGKGQGCHVCCSRLSCLQLTPSRPKGWLPGTGSLPLQPFLAGASLCLWSDYGEVVQSAHPDAWFFLGNQLTRHAVDVQLLIHNQEEAQEPSVSPAAIGICPVYRLIFQT